ncbi:MAG: hypothetical protein AABW73_01360 [Nanoarchaeota archaeon]
METKERTLRLGNRLNDKLNGNWVRPKKVYYGNALTQLGKFLISESDAFKFPDSRPYLERLGIKVLGEIRNEPEYECEIPSNLRLDQQNNESCSDMTTFNIYDASGRKVVSYWVKIGREYDLSVDLRGLQ